MTRPSSDRLLAGEIGKPHGLQGEVYVLPISDDPGRFEPGSVLIRPQGQLTVESSRPHGGRLLVKFEGISSREGAETLRGPLFVSTEQLRALDEDEFWPHDLIGCEVRTDDGSSHGEVREVLPGAAHDLLVVGTPQGDRMIPFVKDIVTKVDVEARVVVVEPPLGLLD